MMSPRKDVRTLFVGLAARVWYSRHFGLQAKAVSAEPPAILGKSVWSSNELHRLDERLFTRFTVNASWLIKLRWVAACGQLITILVVSQILQIALPLAPLFAVIAITVCSNAALAAWFWQRGLRPDPPSRWRTGNRLLAVVMTLDLFSLTTMLYFTGGPNNPFCFFFFVNLSLCALVLSARHAWALTALSLACFAGLMFNFVPLGLDPSSKAPAIVPIRQAASITVSHTGLFAAFVACSTVIVYFMTRLTHELRQNELRLWRAQTSQARNEKLQALGTLAAGAAHELATPLSTIAIVAREVEYEIKSLQPGHNLTEDIELIRAELERCRAILDRMNAEAGQATGEGLSRVTLAGLVDLVLESYPDRDRVRVHIAPDSADAELNVPRGVLAQAIRGLIKNGLDASAAHQSIDLHARRLLHDLEISVEDHGPGMSDEVLQRVCEPFFTTKEPGKGTGLGLFLARSVAEQLGGTLVIESELHEGTTASVRLPLHGETPPADRKRPPLTAPTRQSI